MVRCCTGSATNLKEPSQAMRRFAEEVNLISPRTQRRLVINPRRFRFSIATHMAEEGLHVPHRRGP
jgi:hypothetical protein